MPKTVDHDLRRRELTSALLRVAARDGFDVVSVRTVAAQAGWSPGSLRHYLPTRQHMIDAALGALSERVATRLARRGAALQRCDDAEVVGRACELLEELLPLDTERRDEMAVWLALAVPSKDAALVPWRETMFGAIRHQCRRVIARLRDVPLPPVAVTRTTERAATDLATAVSALPSLPDADDEARAAALHAAVDGLAVHAFGEVGVDRRSVRGTLERLLRDLGGPR